MAGLTAGQAATDTGCRALVDALRYPLQTALAPSLVNQAGLVRCTDKHVVASVDDMIVMGTALQG